MVTFYDMLLSQNAGAGVVLQDPVFTHDFTTDNQTSIAPVDIFEQGKSYVIIGRNIARDPNTGTFSSFSFDLIRSDLASGGPWKFLRTRNQSSTTSLQQSALTNRATVESGMNLDTTGEPCDFAFYVFRPNNSSEGKVTYDLRFQNWNNTTSVILDNGKSFGSQNTPALEAITGFVFPALGNSPIIQGTIEVYEL